MKHIFVEGLQGMGKSTLVQRLSEKYTGHHVYREGDYCPVELAWCSYLTKEQYKHILDKFSEMKEEIEKWTVIEEDKFIVMYTRIITDIPGFHKYMEQYEIYNGRRTLGELENIVLKRYQKLGKTAAGIFECALFQNIIEDLMLFHKRTDEQVSQFYYKLKDAMKTEDFIIFYLYDEDVDKNLSQIIRERCDEDGNQVWYQLMLGYIETCPYGVENALKGYEGLLNHLKHRQALELRIIREIFPEQSIVLPAKNYTGEQLIIR